MRQKPTRLFKAFNRDERGNIALVFGLTCVPLVFMMGMAVDFARAYYARSLIQLASDQAALAGSIPPGLTDSQRVTLALNSFKANTAGSPLTSNVTPCISIGTASNCNANGSAGSNTITVGAGTSTAGVSVTATANVPAYFLSVMNMNSLGVGGQGTVVAGSSNQQIEIGMMIDLTGSMGWTDPATGKAKYLSLQTAGQSLMNILYPNGATNANIRVAIAPMADYVNAGPYAAAATGLANTGGSYANISNLGNTKSGSYYGNYSGIGGGGGGQGYAATSSQTTYTTTYCSNPTVTTTNNATWTDPSNKYGTLTVGTLAVTGTGLNPGAHYAVYNGYTWYVSTTLSATQNGYHYYTSYYYNNNKWNTSGTSLIGTYTANTTSTTTTVPGCESSAASTGNLISCVTERTGKDAYTDASPTSADYVGAYNQGHTATYNYSSDGKCYVAGRELPAVIPLTSNVTTLTNFFNNITVGGGTPGHLGHAWAWYLVSPNWNSLWPSTSQAAAYGGTTKKYVVIMTDGEYNEQYSSVASTTQALSLCTNMKTAGVTVYTIGFGFKSGAKPNDGTSDGAALGLLQSCASNNGTFFYPYDGNALKTAFQTVGSSILGVAKPSTLTH